MRIKVKLYGRYRDCELLRAYRSKATGELGYVDVRVMMQDQTGGMPSMWRYVRVDQVRKADRPAVIETLPVKTFRDRNGTANVAKPDTTPDKPH